MNELRKAITASKTFYHYRDMEAFFQWIAQMDIIEDVRVDEHAVTIVITADPSEDELIEFIGFARRYEIDLKQLATFRDDLKRGWFSTPGTSWFDAVFGAV